MSNKLRNIFPTDTFTDLRKTVLASTVLHLLLLLLFLLVNSGFQVKTGEFAEVNFVSGRVKVPRPIRKTAPPVIKRTATKKPPVELPKRRMMEDDPPEITHRKSDKIESNMDDLPVPTKQEAKYYGKRVETLPGQTGYSKLPTTSDDDIGGKGVPGNEPFAPSGSNDFFSIEGEASKRTIIHQVTPRYPANLQREAIIKIRFNVLADGTVGNMIPMIKGDPALEKAAMSALRQWRFNSLPLGIAAKTVSGVITFHFILR